VSNNPAASRTIADCHRLTPGCFRRPIAHDIAASAKASSNRPLKPGDRGKTGGRGRERGALAEGAVVRTVTVTVVAELPAISGFGETVQLVSAGAPVQEKLIVPANPPRLRTLKL
jgi:hypothetical protein